MNDETLKLINDEIDKITEEREREFESIQSMTYKIDKLIEDREKEYKIIQLMNEKIDKDIEEREKEFKENYQRKDYYRLVNHFEIVYF